MSVTFGPDEDPVQGERVVLGPDDDPVGGGDGCLRVLLGALLILVAACVPWVVG